MTEPLDPGSHVVEVELQIDQVTITGPTEATATVRCILGPVRFILRCADRRHETGPGRHGRRARVGQGLGRVAQRHDGSGNPGRSAVRGGRGAGGGA